MPVDTKPEPREPRVPPDPDAREAQHPLDEPDALSFRVTSPSFVGTLGELAHALRSGSLRPADLDLLGIVRAFLAYYREHAAANLELATETLPLLARVIELKTRLLLPRPPRERDDADEELEHAIDVVASLDELEEAIGFLRRRRDERRVILPARAPRPPYPRAERPLKVGIGRLAEMASKYRTSGYFELAIERFSLGDAMKHVLQRLRQLVRATLRDVAVGREWPLFVVSFTAMLELVKEGKLRARQPVPFGEIELERPDARPATPAPDGQATPPPESRG